MMKEKSIICTVCPLGCNITVHGDEENIESVEGFTCKRGEEYAINEYSHPVRILTSSVRIEGSSVPLVSVRSSKPIPKHLLLPCIEEIRKLTVQTPVHRYDVLIPDILGTGADIVATCDVAAC